MNFYESRTRKTALGPPSIIFPCNGEQSKVYTYTCILHNIISSSSSVTSVISINHKMQCSEILNCLMCLAQFCYYFETSGGGQGCVTNPLLVSRNAIMRLDPGQNCPLPTYFPSSTSPSVQSFFSTTFSTTPTITVVPPTYDGTFNGM